MVTSLREVEEFVEESMKGKRIDIERCEKVDSEFNSLKLNEGEVTEFVSKIIEKDILKSNFKVFGYMPNLWKVVYKMGMIISES